MSLGIVIVLGVISLAVLGLIAFLVHSVIARTDLLASAREDKAKLQGQVDISASEVRAANVAVSNIDNARLRQLTRANALEKELNEVEADPTSLLTGKSGRDRLREALSRTSDTDPPSGQGIDGPVLVPDAEADSTITTRITGGSKPITKP